MTRRLTASIQREGAGYVALCPEVDIATQGGAAADARDNLAEALTLFFKAASTTKIQRRLLGEFYVTQVELALG